MKRLLAVLLLVVCVPAMGAVIVMPSDEQLIDKSDRIAVGTIIGSWPEMLPDKSIQTVYRMVVGEAIRGFDAGDIVEFREWGGVIDGRVTHVSGAPVYETGQRYLVFLAAWGDSFTTVDFGVGKFRFVVAKSGTLLVRDLEEILVWNPILEPHVEDPRIAAEFLAFVRQRAAGTELTSSASATALLGPTSVGTLNTTTAVAFGNLQWNASSIVNYSISATLDTTGQKDLDDSIDVVIPDSSTCNGGSGECISGSFSGSGTVATAFYSGFLEADRIDIVDSDIVIQNGVSSSNTSQTKYNAILTHELGHTIGFRHPNQNKYSQSGTTCTAPLPCSACNNSSDKAVMCSTVQTGADGTLQTWDVAARNNNYTNSSSFDSNYLTWLAGPELPFHRDAPTTAWRINTALASDKKFVDFNGDGKADILWRHYGGGDNAVWFMNGPNFVGASGLPGVQDLSWFLSGAGDFNSDGKSDLVWRHRDNGANAVWFMNGTTFIGAASLPGVGDTNWWIAGVADFNLDGSSDFLWHNRLTGAVAIWLFSGTSFITSAPLPAVSDTSWRLAGAADMNGDFKPDLVWRNYSTGANAVWTLDGSTFVTATSLPGTADTNWQIQVLTDLNGDGRSDLVWRHVGNGGNAVWYMNGTSVSSTAGLPGTLDLQWNMGGPR